MALIWRSIFEVDDERFADEAAAHMQDWLRWKLKNDSIVVPRDGTVEHLEDVEISGREGADGDARGFRGTLFERRDDEEIRTTFTAMHDGTESWAWVDLERWSDEAFEDPWVPVAPALVTALLRDSSCRRGATPVGEHFSTVSGDAGVDAARVVLAADREVPLVVVSPTREERDGDLAPAERRASEIMRRVAGIAPVVLLGPGAVTAFSRELHETLGEGFDVYGGAVRIYLPGVDVDDTPRRHRLVPFHRMRNRPPHAIADLVAPAIQRGACAQAAPAVWRERLLPVLEPRGVVDDELQAELLRLESERERERALRSRAEDTLEAEREAAGETEQENDDLRRKLRWLTGRLEEAGIFAPERDPDEVEEEPFKPDFCAEIPPAAAGLRYVVFPEEQWAEADSLDAHVSSAWAKRAWRTLCAMEAYAEEKQAGAFTGNFREFADSGHLNAIPNGWIALRESETTDNNPRYRALRTLPVDPAVDPSGRVYMPAHIKIEAGGYPAPRIHFYDDTGGATGKIHIGYFGAHLDNTSKN